MSEHRILSYHLSWCNLTFNNEIFICLFFLLHHILGSFALSFLFPHCVYEKLNNVCVCVCVRIYIYIERERERGGERESKEWKICGYMGRIVTFCQSLNWYSVKFSYLWCLYEQWCIDICWHLWTGTDIHWVLTYIEEYVDVNWHVLGCTDVYWYKLTCFEICWCLLTCIDVHRKSLLCVNIHWHLFPSTDSSSVVLSEELVIGHLLR
jgi:hypothetical protein